MNKTVIRTQNLSKQFNSTWVVKNLNIEVYEGEIFAFLGLNGAGKTTTIKLLTGLLKPTRGMVEICGYDIQKDSLNAKRSIGYIPDEPYLYEKLTGREFLEFIAELYSISRKDMLQAIEYFIDCFQMKEYIDNLTQDYSHGMKQKLIFAAAFIHNPRVVIIDEPLVGLDSASGKKIKQLLKKNASEGISFFISTHTLSFAEEIASKIAIIDKGQLVAIGTQEELKTRSGIEGNLEEVFLKITEEER
ncbi:MAG: ABC transporter ATP-binding protein [Candidatus Saelkia tenebricola]|nr:ABC transporter ATP-binding protein [Candidatus Saelkia tenebricola]